MTRLILSFLVLIGGMHAEDAHAYTANKVWFEFRGHIYRVHVRYTVPALKELRESYVEFTNRKKAEKFYSDLIRGVDFYPPNTEDRKFSNQGKKTSPLVATEALFHQPSTHGLLGSRRLKGELHSD